MRQKLNDNPIFQFGALGLLALVVGVLLLMRMGGGGAKTDNSTLLPTTDTATTALDPAAAADPAAGTVPPADSSATPPPAAPAGAEFKAGPGLPADVVNAYDSGDAVALLIVNNRGIDDRSLRRTVEALGTQPDVSVFVTDVKHVADYSRITQGADVDRTPVLIVMRPKSLTNGPLPTVGVAYGFRGSDSVLQAYEDALYKGPDGLPYYP